MAEMGIASFAQHLDPSHEKTIVRFCPCAFFRDHLPEAGPTRAGVIFCLRAEQFSTTPHTAVGPFLLGCVVLSRKGPFRALLTGDVVLIRRELLFPVLVRLYNFLIRHLS